MVSYKTTEDILSIVYGLLSGLTVPVYKGTKPSLAQPVEYVVVNSLPINADRMQYCRVNVNYHAKDLNQGSAVGFVPNYSKIEAGSKLVLGILEKVTGTNYMIDFEGQETMREDGFNEHLCNMKFSFKYINT